MSEDDVVLIVTKKGYGKQTSVREYRETKRGSKGVKGLSITEKNGDIAAFKLSRPDSDIVIITDAGMVMRMSLDQINVLGRVTQGVRLINLKDGHTVATLSLVDKEKDEELSTSEDTQQTDVLGNNPEEIEVTDNSLEKLIEVAEEDLGNNSEIEE